jgi:aminopeptidase-like protein
LTGEGTLQTLEFFQKLIPDLNICSVKSGTQVADWTVPDEWTIRDAYVKDAQGNKLVDFQENNLHVIGYSEPVDCVMSLDDLQPRLRSLPHLPDAIPYHTSYYSKYWGFCLSDTQRKSLEPGNYHVKIDSSLEPGKLHYAEMHIPGETEQEILLSSYCCHPSLANNELSGPCVLAALAQWLKAQPNRRYSYRIVFTVETIGAVVYIDKYLESLRKNVIAGYVLTCCGDDNGYSFSQSRYGNTLADRAVRHVLKHYAENFKEYKFLEIGGSDNIQYCSPNVDLPVCTIMRSAHGNYAEYHNSLDNLDFISPAGLQGTFEVYAKVITLLENNHQWRLNTVGEPQLGQHGLYGSQDKPWPWQKTKLLKQFLGYADGTNDIIDLVERLDCNADDLLELVALCVEAGLVTQ